jgi:hypothetical protein
LYAWYDGCNHQRFSSVLELNCSHQVSITISFTTWWLYYMGVCNSSLCFINAGVKATYPFILPDEWYVCNVIRRTLKGQGVTKSKSQEEKISIWWWTKERYSCNNSKHYIKGTQWRLLMWLCSCRQVKIYIIY